MSKTVAKALQVLQQFTPDRPELGGTEIGRMLGMDKVIVHRLLKSLAQAEFVVQDPTSRRYRIGPGLIALASQNLREAPLTQRALPWVERLRDESDETVMLVVLRGNEVVVALARESRQPMRVTADIGDAESLHTTASGKVMLAYGTPALFDQVLIGGLPARTPTTITAPEKLRAEIKRVRARGWAIDNEEVVPGIRAIAAPVFGAHGVVEACIAIRGPASRLSDTALEALAPKLLAATTALSAPVVVPAVPAAESVPQAPGLAARTAAGAAGVRRGSARGVAKKRVPTVKA